MKKSRYTEIFKLKKMLEDDKIQFIFNDESFEFYQHYHIILQQGEERIISVIQGNHTYGNQEDLLEIMGLLTKEELEIDEVKGYLTADEVYNRIKRYLEIEEKRNKSSVQLS